MHRLLVIVLTLAILPTIAWAQPARQKTDIYFGVSADYKGNEFVSFYAASADFFLGLSEGHLKEKEGRDDLFYNFEFFAGPTIPFGTADKSRLEPFGFNFGTRYSLAKKQKSNFFFQYRLDWVKYKYEEIDYDYAYPDIAIEVRSMLQYYYLENSITVGVSLELDKGLWFFANAGGVLAFNKVANTNYDYPKFGKEIPTFTMAPGYVAQVGIRVKLQ